MLDEYYIYICGGWNLLSITVMQQMAIKYVGWFVGYAEPYGSHITYLWQL
jgi:beta-lactamase class D